MMMNLGQIRQELYDYFGHGENPEPEVVRRFDQYINSVYMEIMSRRGMSKLRQAILSFASVADDHFAVLPMTATRIVSIVDRSNNLPLEEASVGELRAEDPGLDASSATPRKFAIISFAAALGIEPSAAAELFIKSSSTADTDVTVYLDGIITGGYSKVISNKTNGTTGVSLDATITSWIGAKKLYLSSQAKGDITLHETSGAGTELARIPQGRTTSRYTKIQLHPVPTAAVTYHADVILSLDRLENQMDEPLLHEDYHWLVVSGAKRKQMLKDGKLGEYREESRTYTEGVLGLVHLLGSMTAPIVRAPIKFSHLGSNYSDIS